MVTPDYVAGYQSVPELSSILGLVARKTGDQLVNNTTTLVDIDDLVIPSAPADSVWQVVVYPLISTGATPDIKFKWSLPSGATIDWDTHGQTTNMEEVGDESSFNVGSGTPPQSQIFWGVIVVGSTAGDLKLQFAQNVADVSDTKVLKNSVIRAYRLA